eukprot:TRINITY_DN44182_c0_g1_i1.p1 TRINITY_DN44182_c0_g1~~TRINITY_DN44182_c0_g1_i1.p1  ORF type:complete len:109 (-),score=14.60 TRINITY_DN44182_c0_g1_i1:6-332(-)
MLRSLVGSEMCIRDRLKVVALATGRVRTAVPLGTAVGMSVDIVAALSKAPVTRVGCLNTERWVGDDAVADVGEMVDDGAVSYTHLTLPTKRIVVDSVVVGVLKTKKIK